MTNSSPTGVPADLLRFECWSCATELTVPASMAGVTGPCPKCGQILAAPAAPPVFLDTPPPVPVYDSEPELTVSSGSPQGSGYKRPMEPPRMSPLRTPPKPPGKKNNNLPAVVVATVVGYFVGLLGIACFCGAYHINRRILAGPQRAFGHYFSVTVVSAFFLGVYLLAGGVLHLATSSDARREFADTVAGRPTTSQYVERPEDVRSRLEAEFPGAYTNADFAAAEAAASNRKGPDKIRVYIDTLNDRILSR